MQDELELISDGEGLAIRGEIAAVKRFVASLGLSSDQSLDLVAAFGAGAEILDNAPELKAIATRWVKLTKDVHANPQGTRPHPHHDTRHQPCGGGSIQSASSNGFRS